MNKKQKMSPDFWARQYQEIPDMISQSVKLRNVCKNLRENVSRNKSPIVSGFEILWDSGTVTHPLSDHRQYNIGATHFWNFSIQKWSSKFIVSCTTWNVIEFYLFTEKEVRSPIALENISWILSWEIKMSHHFNQSSFHYRISQEIIHKTFEHLTKIQSHSKSFL